MAGYIILKKERDLLIDIKREYVNTGKNITGVKANLTNWDCTDGTKEIEILHAVHEDIAHIRCMLDDLEFEVMTKKHPENDVIVYEPEILKILKDMRKEYIMQQSDMKLADTRLNLLRKRVDKVEAKTLQKLLHDIVLENAEIQQKIISLENTLKGDDVLQKTEKTIQDLEKALMGNDARQKTGKAMYELKKAEKEEKPENGSRLHLMQTLLILITIAAIALAYSCDDPLQVQECELKTALSDISVKYIHSPCKHYKLMEKSLDLKLLAGFDIACNIILLFLTLFVQLNCSGKTLRCCLIGCIMFCSTVFAIASLVTYRKIVEDEGQTTSIDFLKLKSLMLSSLENNYKSDTINIGDGISTAWNKFFIKYDCCAVSEVTGTTNDFDKTPWCTTSGSCQATSSQIPKTCCKGVTEDDYQNAPATCHASVNSGTYKSSCINQMKTLSRETIDGFQVLVIYLSLFAIGIINIMVFLCGIFNLSNNCRNTVSPN